jgi:hypothetical protein
MFGRWYSKRDVELQDRGISGESCYAGHLLADILNRAAGLAGPMGYCEKVDYPEAVDAFCAAVRAFLDDCEEARIRGRRARLFCEDSNGVLCADSNDTKEDLRRDRR